MRTLSYWAKRNPWKARAIIILSQVLLLSLAWFTGNELSFIGKEPPALFMYFFVLSYPLAALTYPSKRIKSTSSIASLYIKQKTGDFLLATATFGMVVCLAANNENAFQFYSSSLASTTSISIKGKEKSTVAEILASLKYRDKSTLTRSEK